MFQSTRPRGARRFRSADQYRHCLFQSTRPYGARRNDANGNIAPDKFQSTRPRGARRDLLDDCKMADQFQSTRPRGARPLEVIHTRFDLDVSIHAPAWGATHIDHLHVPGRGVSIHAPAWGATPCASLFRRLNSSFNPRARVGRDHPWSG